MFRTLIVLLLLGVMAVSFVYYRSTQGVPVNAYAVKALPLEQWVVASGQVRSASLARIGSEVTGRVAERLVHEGDRVAAGQLLLLLHKEELQAQYDQANTALQQLRNLRYPQAMETLQEARRMYAQTEREAKRRAELAARGVLPKEQSEQAQRQLNSQRSALRQAELQVQALAPQGDEERLLLQRLETARASLEKTEIRAPFAGRVQTRDVEVGDLVQPNKVLLSLARTEGLEVVAAVDEKYIAPLALGQTAVVIADAWPQQELQGEVSFIAPTVDSNSGTVDVHIQLLEGIELLRLGMTVSANILTARQEQALVIPNDYVQQQGSDAFVFKAVEDVAERVAVTLGLRSVMQVAVEEGLAAGDVVLLPTDISHEQQKVRPQLEGGR
ncbi:MAG TPA: efflux RND transporter periplasmic adaptor subunit [Alcanivoracaceae bacterium]|nr:efflux RND transporter periplasmic adaptor subunit [Alcanivoracaceae bacterium]